MGVDTLTLFVPYELDARGKCCESRVVVAHAYELLRILRYFKEKLSKASQPYGIVMVHYERRGNQYIATRTTRTYTASEQFFPNQELMDKFEAFSETIHHYERLDLRGLPFPGDEPVLQYPEPDNWLSRGPLRPSVRERHRRRPRIGKPQAPRGTIFDITSHVSGHPLRVRKSDTHLPSPLYPSRSKPEIAFPPRGCHPFVKTRAITDRAQAAIPVSIRNKAFHSYELCEFGDVPRATRDANFKALRRRKGTVIAFYNFYKTPIAIVTDMTDRVAVLMLRSEI